MISESKLDNSFPVAQFEISGYTTPYRFDRNRNGSRILLSIREDIPSKTLHVFKVEGFFVELNLLKTNWLCCIYNPHKIYIRPLREMCPNTEFFSGSYSVRIQENTD